jgi:FixJ family two-component response regulator
MSVRAIKSGAVDFLTKPVAAAVLRDSLRAALHESRRAQGVDRQVQDARERVDSLTLRERQVMLLAVQGQPNKEIARRLGISYRTVEIHRARVMQKTAAETLLELARLVQRSGLDGEPEA